MYYYLPKFDQKTLKGDEAAHFWVTRVQEGDEVQVCDHKGSLGRIKIEQIDKKSKSIRYSLISYETLARRGAGKTLFQAIPDKQYLDKLVELLPIGDIDRLILWESDRSPHYNINWERLEKILIRSTEQCQRLWRPKVELVDSKLLTELLLEYRPVIFDCQGKDQEKSTWESVAIGPEGGWSEDELKIFEELELNIFKVGELVLPAWLAGYSFLS